METKNIFSVIVDDITIDEAVNVEISNLILEGKDFFTRVPGTSYTYRIDKPRGTPGAGNLKHIHLYAGRDKQIFAMNVDGSAHDGYHQIQIPDELILFLRSKGFTIPPTNLIEWIDFTSSSKKQLLFD